MEGAGPTRPRVLLADDNADMREYVRRILAPEYEVCVVPDGESALAAARQQTPDLVLSDIMMPRLDGLGLLRALRADPDTRTVPFIFVSARAGDDARVGGLEAGADDYLVKPFSSRELLARVRSNLELTRVRTEAISSKQEALGAIKLLETVRESEERFRTLANAIPQLCFSANGDGWVSWYNQRWYEYTGSTPEQLEGWGWQSVHDPEVLPQVIKEWKVSIATGSPFEMEFPLRGRDGQFRPFLARAIPVYDVGGNVFQWFGTCTDITERKAAEKALENLNAELEARVAERTAELREKDEILIQQNRQAAVGEMLGNIAHHWRQPLNVLALVIQQLLIDYEMDAFDIGLLDERVSKCMEVISHMSRTIDDFRNLFLKKDKVQFKAEETIRKTLSFIQHSLGTDQLTTEIVAESDPVIYGAPSEFAQVLINILINAKDIFTERTVGDPKVTITICSEGGSAVVVIRDNGGGIPDAIIKKVFDLYFTTKGPQHGRGIGLFMSKMIIEKKMGGKLSVGNVAGGAEFRIEVPSESSVECGGPSHHL
jgi:PAS domain S-box-containing protein